MTMLSPRAAAGRETGQGALATARTHGELCGGALYQNTRGSWVGRSLRGCLFASEYLPQLSDGALK